MTAEIRTEAGERKMYLQTQDGATSVTDMFWDLTRAQVLRSLGIIRSRQISDLPLPLLPGQASSRSTPRRSVLALSPL